MSLRCVCVRSSICLQLYFRVMCLLFVFRYVLCPLLHDPGIVSPAYPGSVALCLLIVHPSPFLLIRASATSCTNNSGRVC